jgi:hypothetical protein
MTGLLFVWATCPSGYFPASLCLFVSVQIAFQRYNNVILIPNSSYENPYFNHRSKNASLGFDWL